MTDYTALTRRDWLALANRFYEHLDPFLAALTSSEWARPTPYFGWSAKDVLAHMTSAMPVNFRQMLDRALTGDPSAPAEFDTFNRNAREVARRRERPAREVLDEFRRELNVIMGVYRSITDADWARPAWFFVGRVSVRTLFLVQLADNVFHERDLALPNGRWRGIEPRWGAPLLDWFMREFRAATFRPDRADGLRGAAVYRLTGAAGGEWTTRVRDGRCTIVPGGDPNPDITLEAAVEDLVAAALGRAPPWVGRAARALDWMAGRDRTEDTVAGITGRVSLVTGLALRRIRVSGDRSVARAMSRAFWHFWERTRQTEGEHRARLGLGEQPSQVQRLGAHLQLTVFRARPFRRRAIAIQLDAIPIRITQVHRLAHPMVRRPLERDPVIQHSPHRAGERRPIGIENREVIESRGPAWRSGCVFPGPGIEPDVMVVAARGDEHGVRSVA